MYWGDFRSHFVGVAWKRLTSTEVDPRVSNGHEFQGVARLRAILGSEDRKDIPTTYVLVSDTTEAPTAVRATASWYDSRREDPNRSAEWRLYYSAAAGVIQARMKPGDLIVLAVTKAGHLLVLLAPQSSTRERQLLTLFQIEDDQLGLFSAKAFSGNTPIDFIDASLLEDLGIAVVPDPQGTDANLAHALARELVESHSEALPPGAVIASLVRARLTGVDPVADPDDALFKWIETEAATYRSWEDQKIERRISQGFVDSLGRPDVELFRSFSMFLRQSRVSRAGNALQYHFRELLDLHRIRYAQGAAVDGGEIPDFLFPGLREYEDRSFPAGRLRMVGAKFTAKDRWRQVLNEAERIWPKHLLTLEAGISKKQLSLMAAAKLVLAMPKAVKDRYPAAQADSLLSVGQLIAELRSVQ
jgi:hypothetical protein